MKILIAVITCRTNTDRVRAIKSTWYNSVPSGQADIKFFTGRGPIPVPSDYVCLDVDDSYGGLPEKVRAVMQWALEHDYSYICKTDDDTYIQPQRLLASGFVGRDYAGKLRGPSGQRIYPYASGFCYWLSNRAAAIIAHTDPGRETAEDRFVGNTLYAAGFKCHPDYRYTVLPGRSRNAHTGLEGPRQGNDVIAAGELEPPVMARIHREWLTNVSNKTRADMTGEFSDLCVMVKTFLRDGYLTKTVAGIEEYLPGAKIIVVDDGYESRQKITYYSELRSRGHITQWLPFDSGFCAKSNEAIRLLDREFVLVASDDFDFTHEAAYGVHRLLTVARGVPDTGVVSGRVDHNPYEGFIERGPGYIREHLLDTTRPPDGVIRGTPFWYCDITVNFSVVRSRVFQPTQFRDCPDWVGCVPGLCPTLKHAVRWNEEYKIGGDHFEFFDQVAQTGWRVAVVPDVSISQLPYNSADQHIDYTKYRGRAVQSLPRFFRKYGIQKYVAFDGGADVMSESGRVVREGGVVRMPPRIDKSLKYYTSPKRLYLAHDGTVVEQGDSRARSLLVPKGGRMSVAEATRHGLI